MRLGGRGRVPTGWLLIEDSEIICTSAAGNVAGLGESGFIARRVEIRGCTNGLDGDANFTIEDSYVHSLPTGECVGLTVTASNPVAPPTCHPPQHAARPYRRPVRQRW